MAEFNFTTIDQYAKNITPTATIKQLVHAGAIVGANAQSEARNLSPTRVQPVDIKSALGFNTTPNIIINKKVENTSGVADLKYPDDLGDIYMSFAFSNYSRPSGFNELKLDPLFTIHLPLPENILESYSVRLDSEDTEGSGDIASRITELYNKFKETGDIVTTEDVEKTASQGAVRAGMRTAIGLADTASSSTIGGPAGQISGQFAGAIPNPHASVFFKGVDLRSHTFQWKLIPENEAESKTLREILNKIKYHMLPDFGTLLEGSTLAYPSIVKPHINGLRPDTIPPFKHCMIKNFNIIHTPDGIPAFYRDKSPIGYQVTLELLEIEYFTRGDGASTPPLTIPEIQERFTPNAPGTIEGAQRNLTDEELVNIGVY